MRVRRRFGWKPLPVTGLISGSSLVPEEHLPDGYWGTACLIFGDEVTEYGIDDVNLITCPSSESWGSFDIWQM